MRVVIAGVCANIMASVIMPVEGAASSLTVDVQNAAHSGGQIIAALFDQPSFLDKPIAKVTAEIGIGGSSEVVFDSLPEGDYAVVIVHDEDRDGRMTRSLLRLPQERYVFSNNIVPRFRKPKFEDVKFEVASPTKIEVRFSGDHQDAEKNSMRLAQKAGDADASVQ